MASLLEDLDELTLRCRDEKARQYIAEAVASYRAGAFRAAIVAAWIAVCFDVIEKLRELALAGDQEAERQVQELEATRRTGDLTRALKFERELLVLAKDKFELISPLEYIDLERLQTDRNRCAHPSLTSEEQAYMPSAELSRLHIHSAVTHLLQHPPVQGKYALDRLLQEINSDYFPTSAKAARVAFGSGPLRRPRDSLVRNLVIVLCKTLVSEKPDWKRRYRLAAALQAVTEMHHAQCIKILAEKLSAMFRAVPDTELISTVLFLKDLPAAWSHLEPDVRQRVENFVSALPSREFDEIGFLLSYSPLRSQALSRAGEATKKDLRFHLFFDLPVELGDRYITLYLQSESRDDADEWARQMSVYAGDFQASHVRRLLESVAGNPAIRGSAQLGTLLKSLRERGVLPEVEFDALLEANGLSSRMLDESEAD